VDAHRHRIIIRGGPSEALRAAFGDFDIEPRGADTVLIGELDYSRMREVTMRAKALGLMIVDLSVQDERRDGRRTRAMADCRPGNCLRDRRQAVLEGRLTQLDVPRRPLVVGVDAVG
jgi:hypothetical protein